LYNSPPRHSDTHYRAQTTHQPPCKRAKRRSKPKPYQLGWDRPPTLGITTYHIESYTKQQAGDVPIPRDAHREGEGSCRSRRSSADKCRDRRAAGHRAAYGPRQDRGATSSGRAERGGQHGARTRTRSETHSAGGQHKGTQIHRHGRPGRAVGCSGRRASDTRTHHNHTQRHLERGQAGLEQPATPSVRLSPRPRPLWSLSRQHRETAPLTASPEAQRCTTTRDRRPGSLRWAVRGQLTQRHAHTVSPMAGALPSTLAPQHLSRPAASATRVHKLFSQ